MTHKASVGHRYFQYSFPSNMTVWLPIVRKICGNLIRLKYLLKAANKSENRKHDMSNQEDLICRNANPIQRRDQQQNHHESALILHEHWIIYQLGISQISNLPKYPIEHRSWTDLSKLCPLRCCNNRQYFSLH
jgi:hypothetical protein